jgi:hypothetical protein
MIALGLLAGCGSKAAPEPESSPDAAPAATGSAAAPEVPILAAASYPPRDDCTSLPGWNDFREKLGAAVAARDADALAALADPDVRLDFGGGAGTAELRRRLDAADHRLWDELAALLPLGCGPQEGGGAAMPWIYASGPEVEDPFSALLVLGPAVPAHAEGRPDSPVTARLNWAIVTTPGASGPGKAFTKVTLPDGEGTAYVASDRLRSFVDYRLLATRTVQGWRITALVAGD